MAQQNGASGDVVNPAEFATTLREIREGEQQAAMMEKNLTALEKKIDAMLVMAEKTEREVKARQASQAGAAQTQLENAAPTVAKENTRE
ncbi:uncharacterized protein PV09_05398 [Verruconis gallopava]|uniref:Uncharacterized protein n=1 Tax=Verruconis gallopava TaxID=253628 RepID=A0A0D1XL90_9PEZI|nr:uncharacterized protein PV09_05398 [Verruconis gallopava]KIW03171.1 hypothetical protein PV09_05398 [Verruconis gallopava]